MLNFIKKLFGTDKPAAVVEAKGPEFHEEMREMRTAVNTFLEKSNKK